MKRTNTKQPIQSVLNNTAKAASADNTKPPLMTSAYIRESNDRWLNETIKRQFAKHRRPLQTLDGYLQKNAYFVTMTFNPGTVIAVQKENGIDRNSTDVQWDNFQLLYTAISRRLLGPRYNKPKNVELLPYAFAAIDAEGSKTAGLLHERDLSNFHIHAIWINHPIHKDAFQEFIRSMKYRRCLSKLYADAVEFDPFDPAKGSIERLFSYTVKLFWKDRGQLGLNDIIRIYPNANFSNEARYRQSDEYVPGNIVKLKEATKWDLPRRSDNPRSGLSSSLFKISSA